MNLGVTNPYSKKDSAAKVVFGAALSAAAVIFSGFSASMEAGDGFHLMEGEGEESGRDFPVRSQKVGRKWTALKIRWALQRSVPFP